ncbi:MAG: redoxin domain-containing protein [Saprospiraceae bacterium]|nr:redoxin domain-containing protein [Saprospiraceae bacterium]
MTSKISGTYLFGIIMFFLLTCHHLSSAGVVINVNLRGLTYDTIWFGRTYGRQVEVDFYGLKKEDGTFTLETNKEIKPGFYAIAFKTSAESRYGYFNIAITDEHRNFSIAANVNNVHRTVSFDHSPASNQLYAYRNQVVSLMDEYSKIFDTYRLFLSEDLFKFITAKEQAIHELQVQFLREYPESLIADFIKRTPFDYFPENANWETERKIRNQYYRTSYLRNFHVEDSIFWSLPLGIDWLDHYTFRVWESGDEEAIRATDQLVEMLKPNEKAYRYYLRYMLNSFSQMNKYDLGRIYVYLVRKYVDKGKAPWMSEEDYYRYSNLASHIDRLMTGSLAPDIRFYDRANRPFNVMDVNADLTMLIFWNPDCPNCKKEIPIIASIYNEFSGLGLKILAVCGKKAESVSMCWEYIDTLQFPAEWLFLADPQTRSNYQVMYHITTFPSIYVLDREKRIVFRRKGSMQEYELRHLFEKLSRR